MFYARYQFLDHRCAFIILNIFQHFSFCPCILQIMKIIIDWIHFKNSVEYLWIPFVIIHIEYNSNTNEYYVVSRFVIQHLFQYSAGLGVRVKIQILCADIFQTIVLVIEEISKKLKQLLKQFECWVLLWPNRTLLWDISLSHLWSPSISYIRNGFEANFEWIFNCFVDLTILYVSHFTVDFHDKKRQCAFWNIKVNYKLKIGYTISWYWIWISLSAMKGDFTPFKVVPAWKSIIYFSLKNQ